MKKKQSEMNWRTDWPENADIEVLHAFGCDFIPVLSLVVSNLMERFWWIRSTA